jgi:hypothetical protein
LQNEKIHMPGEPFRAQACAPGRLWNNKKVRAVRQLVEWRQKRDACLRARSAVPKAMPTTRGRTVSTWRIAPNFLWWLPARALARTDSHFIHVEPSGSL